MSDLTFIERARLEKMFEMAEGYVLSFSNRTLAEFVAESTGRDISDPKYSHASGSKANRLRAFWAREPNHLVGKLMTDLIEYCRATTDGPDRASLLADCQRIAARLMERAPVDASDAGPRQSYRGQRSVDLETLKREFLTLHESPDRHQAGLKLEELINKLFALNDLAPREPFRVIGEQIDGSFELDYELYLLEAKWHRDPIPAADLYVFREKVIGKSQFTRGVFLSINGITRDAQDAITRGKQPNFFVIDGYDIMMVLEDVMNLRTFLRRRQRLLAEGRVCVPFGEVLQ